MLYIVCVRRYLLFQKIYLRIVLVGKDEGGYEDDFVLGWMGGVKVVLVSKYYGIEDAREDRIRSGSKALVHM